MSSNRDNNLEYLAYLGVVLRWAARQYELKRADLELMLYLHSLKYFTRQQFKDGELIYPWDTNRFSKLLKEGHIEKSYSGNRRLGEHDKYILSSKTVRMLRRIDRILDGREEMPQSVRNKVWTGKRYSDKVLKTAIIKKNGSNTTKRSYDDDQW